MSDKKEIKNKINIEEVRKKDFIKVFNLAYDNGYRITKHPFGQLMQKGCIGFNMQHIYVWEAVNKTDKKNTYTWKKKHDYTGNYDDFIVNLEILDKTLKKGA